MQTPSGTAVSGASIDVYNAGGVVHATIYSDDGITSVLNPLTSASDGTFGFYVADGRYDLKVSGTGITTRTFSDVEIFDATEKNAGDGTLTASAANFTTLTVTGDTTLAAVSATTVNATSGVQVNGAAAANTFLKGNGTNYISGSPILASADFANQGTTTTVLHGNAAGNPSFGAVALATDVSGVLPLGNLAAPTGTGFTHITGGARDVASKLVSLTASTDVAANQGTTTTVLHGNAAGQASFATVTLTTDVTGILPTANGGTAQNSTATFPTSGVVVTEAASETLTNKTIASPVNGFTTVAQSVPLIVAQINTTGLSANVGSAVLLAVPASGGGVYRASGYAVVTQQATTSSTLPNIQLTFTDSDTNTSGGTVSLTANSAGSPVNPSVGFNSENALAATGLTGSGIINVKASTNINYLTANYASVGGTAMNYAIHLRLEYLG